MPEHFLPGALPQTLPDLSGRTAVITGAGRGIGRCIAASFAKAGAAVYLGECDAAAGRDAEDLIRSQGGSAVWIPCDVACETDVDRLMAAASSVGIDYLINNAGIARADTAHIFSDSARDFDRVLAVNLRGPFLCARAAIPHMRGRMASIVNIASTRALMSEPRTEGYAAAKGGLVALTHALAVSLENSQITVNCISPGWIDTSAWQIGGAVPAELSEADHRQHPAGRVGVPADIAAACLWLCSGDARFITGANFVIDGGMTRRMHYA
jgi:hypothetical protein